jgi:hypothetical protein
MPRVPMSDDFDPEDLDGSDYAQSFERYERFGPVAATGEASPDRDVDFRERAGNEIEGLRSPEGAVNKFELLVRANYKCEKCGVELRDRSDLLNPHHPGRDKSTNRSSFLMLLCVVCHTKCEDHSFMRIKYYASYQLVVRRKREQGKWSKGEEEYERLSKR